MGYLCTCTSRSGNQATHGGVVDFNFAEFYSQMVRYRGDAGPRISETVVWYPTAFRWDVNGEARYHYLMVKASCDVSNEIFKEVRGGRVRRQ